MNSSQYEKILLLRAKERKKINCFVINVHKENAA